jgi:hypothetical protein
MERTTARVTAAIAAGTLGALLLASPAAAHSGSGAQARIGHSSAAHHHWDGSRGSGLHLGLSLGGGTGGAAIPA